MLWGRGRTLDSVVPFDVDKSRWPIVQMRLWGSLTSDEEDLWVETSTTFPLEGKRYVAIIDLLEANTPTVRFMRLQAQGQQRRREALSRYCAGVAFVIGSPMMRGALRAILHLGGLPSPHVVVNTREDAVEWSMSQLGHRSGAAAGSVS